MKYISDILLQTIKVNGTCNLKELDISNCDLTEEHIQSLHPCIPCFEHLNIGNNYYMSPKSMKYISDILLQTIKINGTCNLKELDISACTITDEHIECLLPCIPSLKDLNLSHNNQMSVKSMKHISNILIGEKKEQ